MLEAGAPGAGVAALVGAGVVGWAADRWWGLGVVVACGGAGLALALAGHGPPASPLATPPRDLLDLVKPGSDAGYLGVLTLALVAVAAWRIVPMPASAIQQLPGIFADAPWAAALVPAVVAAGLAVACGVPRRAAWFLLPLPLLDSALLCGRGLLLPTLHGPAERVGRLLAAGEGGVLDLPLALGDPSLSEAQGRYLLLQTLHGRPLAGPRDPAPRSWLYAAPLVMVALDVVAGHDRWAVPPGEAGWALQAQGVGNVVVHREYVAPERLALLDPVLRRAFDPPMRDLAAGIDVYALPAGSAARVDTAPLVESWGPLPAGYTHLDSWLASWR